MNSEGLIILIVFSFLILTVCTILAIMFLKDCKQIYKIVKRITEKQEDD